MSSSSSGDDTSDCSVARPGRRSKRRSSSSSTSSSGTSSSSGRRGPRRRLRVLVVDGDPPDPVRDCPTLGEPIHVCKENLVSDMPGVARFHDPVMINPWGISALPRRGAIVIAQAGTGLVTAYTGKGVRVGAAVMVPVPPSSQSLLSSPTAVTRNDDASAFEITGVNGSAASTLLVATEDGTISGWNVDVSPGRAVITVDRSRIGDGAVYKGLAVVRTKGGVTNLYAANFRSGAVEKYDCAFNLVGTFTDPAFAGASGVAPFNVQNIGGFLFVTFAVQDALKNKDVPGHGNGFVSIFDANGNFIRRLVSGGVLNSPWGMAYSCSGRWNASDCEGGTLYVGNAGDGLIHAFDVSTGSLVGTLTDAEEAPIRIGGLWGLQFGTGGLGGSDDCLYFTAGIGDEEHGLFGVIRMASPCRSDADVCGSGPRRRDDEVWRADCKKVASTKRASWIPCD